MSSRIVVIDDSPTFCAILRRVLEREMYVVETHLRPLPAIQAIWKQAETPPVALLLDIQLPQMDGYTITQMIRTTSPGALRSLPIIGISARDGVTDRIKALLVGMNAYLTKPFDPGELLDALAVLQAQPLPLAS